MGINSTDYLLILPDLKSEYLPGQLFDRVHTNFKRCTDTTFSHFKKYTYY